MRAVVTRVNRARVTRAETGEVLGEIGKGFLVLLGIHVDDTEKEAAKIADRVLGHTLRRNDQRLLNGEVREQLREPGQGDDRLAEAHVQKQGGAVVLPEEVTGELLMLSRRVPHSPCTAPIISSIITSISSSAP